MAAGNDQTTPAGGEGAYRFVVWDLTVRSNEPQFGPMTAEDAEHWRGREHFWVQQLPAPAAREEVQDERQ